MPFEGPMFKSITGKKNPSSSCSAWPTHWHRDYIGSPTGKKVCPKYSYYLFSPLLPERKKVVILIKIRCLILRIKHLILFRLEGSRLNEAMALTVSCVCLMQNTLINAVQ